MYTKKELRQLSKNELITLLLAEHEARMELEKRINQVEHHLKAFENPHTPSSKQQKKNTDDVKEDKPRFPGKPKGGAGGGIEIPPPDEVVEHTLDKDPRSGLHLGAPVGYRRKITIDMHDKPIIVTEHRIMQYLSPTTGRIVEPSVDLPSGIYGPNIKSLVVMLKSMTNSCERVALLMQELGAPSFSTAQVQNICDEATKHLQTTRDDILTQLRDEPYVHSDETGMRRDGKNGYVWGLFSQTRAIFFATLSRGRTIIENLLGDFLGILVSDGYVAYNYYRYRQRCWAHLLREVKAHTDNKEIAIQYLRLKKLYEQLKVLNENPPDEVEIQKVKFILSDIVTCLRVIKQAKPLVTLIENGGEEWFTALYFDGVPLENNHAERGLRPLVLLRKTIGCYRNKKGENWINVVLSVLYTWQLQQKSIFQNLRKLNWT